jgi:hypothetical protein
VAGRSREPYTSAMQSSKKWMQRVNAAVWYAWIAVAIIGVLAIGLSN